jgi:hypothetical protein
VQPFALKFVLILFYPFCANKGTIVMKMRLCLLAFLVAGPALGLQAQNPAPVANPYTDPMANISSELSRISKSVQMLNDKLKSIVDKFAAVGGS